MKNKKNIKLIISIGIFLFCVIFFFVLRFFGGVVIEGAVVLQVTEAILQRLSGHAVTVISLSGVIPAHPFDGLLFGFCCAGADSGQCGGQKDRLQFHEKPFCILESFRAINI